MAAERGQKSRKGEKRDHSRMYGRWVRKQLLNMAEVAGWELGIIRTGTDQFEVVRILRSEPTGQKMFVKRSAMNNWTDIEPQQVVLLKEFSYVPDSAIQVLMKHGGLFNSMTFTHDDECECVVCSENTRKRALNIEQMVIRTETAMQRLFPSGPERDTPTESMQDQPASITTDSAGRKKFKLKVETTDKTGVDFLKPPKFHRSGEWTSRRLPTWVPALPVGVEPVEARTPEETSPIETISAVTPETMFMGDDFFTQYDEALKKEQDTSPSADVELKERYLHRQSMTEIFIETKTSNTHQDEFPLFHATPTPHPYVSKDVADHVYDEEEEEKAFTVSSLGLGSISTTTRSSKKWAIV